MNSFEKQYYEDESFWAGTIDDNHNRERIKETISLIPEDVTSLADIGCGNGVFLNQLKNLKPDLRLLGIDRSEAAIKYLTTEKKIGSINSIDLPSASFDCISCLEVIEHLPFDIYEQSLDELIRVTSKYLLISVPNQEDLEENINQCPHCKTIFNKDLHLRSFTREQLKSLFENKGLRLIKSKTLGERYSFFGHKWYTNLFYANSRYRPFTVSICPVCGFMPQILSDVSSNKILAPKLSIKKRILSTFSSAPKLIWPKKRSHYWLMALFAKE